MLKINYFRQLTESFIYKMLMILTSFLLMPLMLKYLGEERYGIWLTMYSIVSWASFFDLGIGNGLRNKISEYLEQKKYDYAVKSISSAYVCIFLICFIVYVSFSVIAQFINWDALFNTKDVSFDEIQLSFMIVFGFFLVNFFLSIVDQLFHATKDTAKTILRPLASNIFALIAVYFVNVFFDSSLVYLAVVYGFSLILSSLLLTLYFYIKYPSLTPKLKYFNKKQIFEIMNLGGQFLIIQIAVLIIFTTDKIIISQVVSPAAVVPYETTFKLFGLVLVMNSVFLNPLWSSYTRAFARGDSSYIKKILKMSHIVFLILSLFAVLLYFFSKEIIKFWMSDQINIQNDLALIMCAFFVVRVWCDVYAYFLNGISKIKIQMYLAIIQAMINLPISIFLGKEFGVVGVIAGSLITLSLSAFILPIYTYYLIRKINAHSSVPGKTFAGQT